MKILMINVVCGIRSTGRMCTDLASVLEEQGHEVKIAYGRENVPEQFQKYAVRIGNDRDVKLHGGKARVLDGAGFGSRQATIRFMEWVKKFDPDVIHLHNLHGYYIHIGILFEYLRNCGKKIIWTLHDCWSFTGHCVYFDYAGCGKWKTGCGKCPQKKEYPSCIGVGASKRNYQRKKSLFTGIPSLTLVTPSRWLSGLVKQSFMAEYKVRVIPNGVDTKVFRPTENRLREKYRLADKKVVLGIAAVWDRRKGLEDFVKLSERLPAEYQIVLVGVTKEQAASLPDTMVTIEKTDHPKELAAWYTLADVFVNPTLEDNYPTTNLESIACGTPVVTYDTGGSSESAGMFGVSVPKKDIDQLAEAVQAAGQIRPGRVNVDYRNTVKKYLEIYREMEET